METTGTPGLRRPPHALPFLLAAVPPLVRPSALLAADEGGAGLVSVDLGLAILTIIVFLLVLWVLGRFAWKPILGLLDAREGGIRESIDEAKAMRTEAQALLEEQRREIAEGRRQAQQIVADAREVADRTRREIEAKAREEGERLLAQARSEIGRERDRAIEQIRTEAVDLALSAASRILDERLTEARDRALVEGLLQELTGPPAEA